MPKKLKTSSGFGSKEIGGGGFAFAESSRLRISRHAYDFKVPGGLAGSGIGLHLLAERIFAGEKLRGHLLVDDHRRASILAQFEAPQWRSGIPMVEK